MNVSLTTKGVDGLAGRLAAAVLGPVAEARAGAAAEDLAAAITAETGVRPSITGAPSRPVVRVSDPQVLARVRGSAEMPGEPLLDRARLAFARRVADVGTRR